MGAIAIACFQTTNLENCIMKLSLQYLRYLCLLVSAIGLLHFKAMPAAVAAVRPKITETFKTKEFGSPIPDFSLKQAVLEEPQTLVTQPVIPSSTDGLQTPFPESAIEFNTVNQIGSSG